MSDRLIVFGQLTRLDGQKCEVYFVYEIEDDKAQVGIASGDPVDVNEPYSTIKNWRKVNVTATERRIK